MGSIDLSEAPVLLIFEQVELAGFFDSLEALVYVCLFRVDDPSNLSNLFVLDLNLGFGLFLNLFSPLERFPQLYELVEQLVMLFFFLTEFVVKVFIKLLLRFFLLNKVLDLWVAITLQLGNQPLLIRLLLGLVLLLKLLIGLVRCLFLLV